MIRPVTPGVIMGIDWGVRRIGLSVSDPTQTLARPLKILDRKGKDLLPLPEDEKTLESLASLVREMEITNLVFGVPYYHLSGDPNPHAPIFLEAGRIIGKLFSLPVIFFDEGQTSERARELFARKKRRQVRKDRFDDLAAVLLLQGFLDEQALHRSTSGRNYDGVIAPLERNVSGQ